MDLTFEKGNKDQPKGHAILYYLAGDKILATYLAVLPLKLDLSKYVPPFLASQMKSSGIDEFSSFAIPPVPEEIEHFEYLERLADFRGDDLIYAGTVREDDPLEAANQVNDAVQTYASIYQNAVHEISPSHSSDSSPMDSSSDLDVGEVMLSLMSERDKLGELAKLLSKLQFAVEGTDDRLIQESKDEITLLAKHLPEKYHISQIVDAVSQPSPKSSQLAQFYLERCYKIVDENLDDLGELEKMIEELHKETPESS
tara:strand:+ start:1512 stop:2279 length:768 start_codon:yes stop_codon:yes gene_type:complete